jgi:hypothetical protein
VALIPEGLASLLVQDRVHLGHERIEGRAITAPPRIE